MLDNNSNNLANGSNMDQPSSSNQVQPRNDGNVGNYKQVGSAVGQETSEGVTPPKKKGFLGSINIFKNKGKKTDTNPGSQYAQAETHQFTGNTPTAQSTISPYQEDGTKRKKSFKPLILVLIIFLLILIGFFVVSKLREDRISEPTDTQGELVWWGLEDERIYESVIKKYEEENPNVKVNYEQKSEENYRERLSNAFASGSGPDMFTFHNSWVPMLRKHLDRIPSTVMSAEEFENTFYPVATADLSTVDGVWGIPLEFDAITLYVNEEVFSTAGKILPTKWDELEDLAKELTQRDSRGLIIQSGASLGYTENVDYWQEILGMMIFQNHSVPTELKAQRTKNAIKYYRQFRGDNVWSEILPPSTTAFANGDVAMFFGPVEAASEIKRINPSLQFETIVVPQLRKDNPSETDISYATYLVQGVWNKSEHRGISWNFLKYLSSQEVLKEIYENASEVKFVGDPYPRRDMAGLLKNDEVAGSVIALAVNAKSWYLSSLIDDGKTGINSKLSRQYERLIRSGLNDDTIGESSKAVSNILIEYGLKSKPGLLKIEN